MSKAKKENAAHLRVVSGNPLEKPIAAEVIAENIVAISTAMKKISASRLNRRAIIVLLADATRIGRNHIELVLDKLEDLERIYLKPKAGK